MVDWNKRSSYASKKTQNIGIGSLGEMTVTNLPTSEAGGIS